MPGWSGPVAPLTLQPLRASRAGTKRLRRRPRRMLRPADASPTAGLAQGLLYAHGGGGRVRLPVDDVIVFAFGALAVLVIGTLVRLATAFDRRRTRRRLRCPEVGRMAECIVEQDTRTGRWIDVAECSLHGPRRRPGCSRSCVRLVEHGYVE